MKYVHYGDFETFMIDEGRDAIFKACNKETGLCLFQSCRIVEIITLPNDYLLGMVRMKRNKDIWEEDCTIYYFNLSELFLQREIDRGVADYDWT